MVLLIFLLSLFILVMKYFIVLVCLLSGCRREPVIDEYDGNFYQYINALNDYSGVNYYQFMNAVRGGDCVYVGGVLEGGYRPPIPPSGVTALHEASGYGSLEMVSLLVPCFDINSKSNQGMTPLHFACISWTSNGDIVKYLIDNGADPLLTDVFGNTPLDYALENGYENRVQVLEVHLRDGD